MPAVSAQYMKEYRERNRDYALRTRLQSRANTAADRMLRELFPKMWTEYRDKLLVALYLENGVVVPRGATAEEGATNVAPNGYHYTKQGGKWRLTHHITAEATLGRSISPEERVEFIDKDRKDPYEADNIRVVKKNKGTNARKRAQLEARIQEMQAQLELLEDD